MPNAFAAAQACVREPGVVGGTFAMRDGTVMKLFFAEHYAHRPTISASRSHPSASGGGGAQGGQGVRFSPRRSPAASAPRRSVSTTSASAASPRSSASAGAARGGGGTAAREGAGNVGNGRSRDPPLQAHFGACSLPPWPPQCRPGLSVPFGAGPVAAGDGVQRARCLATRRGYRRSPLGGASPQYAGSRLGCPAWLLLGGRRRRRRQRRRRAAARGRRGVGAAGASRSVFGGGGRAGDPPADAACVSCACGGGRLRPGPCAAEGTRAWRVGGALALALARVPSCCSACGCRRAARGDVGGAGLAGWLDSPSCACRRPCPRGRRRWRWRGYGGEAAGCSCCGSFLWLLGLCLFGLASPVFCPACAPPRPRPVLSYLCAAQKFLRVLRTN